VTHAAIWARDQLAPGTWDQALAGVLSGSPGPATRRPRPPPCRDRDIPRRRLARRTQPAAAQHQPPRSVL